MLPFWIDFFGVNILQLAGILATLLSSMVAVLMCPRCG